MRQTKSLCTTEDWKNLDLVFVAPHLCVADGGINLLQTLDKSGLWTFGKLHVYSDDLMEPATIYDNSKRGCQNFEVKNNEIPLGQNTHSYDET